MFDIAPLSNKLWRQRVCTPEETLRRIAPHLAQIGITRVCDLTGLDRIGIPVVQAVRPGGLSLSVAQGKGLTPAAARASAVMEAAEGWHAERIGLPRCTGPLREALGGLPADWLPGGGAQVGAVATLVAGWDLATGAEAWLPLDLVHKDYTAPVEVAGLCRSTNGLASGNTWDEALASALHEVIERDAMALHALAPRDVRARRRVDPATLAARHPDLAWLIERIAAAGLHLWLHDITSDVGVPAIRAEIGSVWLGRGAGRPRRRISAGAGCHLDPVTAAIRAITEAAQSRLTDIAGSRDDLAQSYYRPAPAGNLDAFLAHAEDRLDHPAAAFDHPDASGASADCDVAHLVRLLVDAGLPRLLCCDLSRPDLPIHVARVVVPGLGWIDGHSPHAGGRALP